MRAPSTRCACVCEALEIFRARHAADYDELTGYASRASAAGEDARGMSAKSRARARSSVRATTATTSSSLEVGHANGSTLVTLSDDAVEALMSKFTDIWNAKSCTVTLDEIRACIDALMRALTLETDEKAWVCRARERTVVKLLKRFAEGLLRASDWDRTCERGVDEVLYAMRRVVVEPTCAAMVRVNCARVVVHAFCPKRKNVILFDEARLLDKHWNVLMECLPSVPVDDDEVLAMASPNARTGVGMRDWALSVAACLAHLAARESEKERELMDLIEKLLTGSGGSRVLGLTVLQGAFSVEGLIKSDDLVRALHKALTAMSSAPVEQGYACVSVGMRAVCTAARFLQVSDVCTLRDAWLGPRLTAMGVHWKEDGKADRLSICNYLRIPRQERLSPTTISAFVIAELDLVGYVSADDFKRKVVHGGVDLDESAFRRLPDDERAMGHIIAGAVVATQMNLVHALYIAPTEEIQTDSILMKFANEGGKILCTKALQLMELERINKQIMSSNADVKIDEMTSELQIKVVLSVLTHTFTQLSVDLSDEAKLKILAWCCEKLNNTFVTVSNDALGTLISSGCTHALLRLAETSTLLTMREACIRCYSCLLDLCTDSATFYDFVELIAFKTPSLDLLGVENKSEIDRQNTYLVAAMNWTLSISSRTLLQADEVLGLFRRLFIMLPIKEHASWFEHVTNAFAGAALWVDKIENDVLKDAERVLTDKIAQSYVDSFDDTSIDASEFPEWVQKLRLRAAWLREAIDTLNNDPTMTATFTSNLTSIISKSVEFNTKGKADSTVNTSYWPGKQSKTFIVARSPLGPGGIMVAAASVFDFVAAQLERCIDELSDENSQAMFEQYEGLSYMLHFTISSLVSAARAVPTPGGVVSGRIASTGARALTLAAKCTSHFAVYAKTMQTDPSSEAQQTMKRTLEAANGLEQCMMLATAPGAHRRHFASARAQLARALSIADDTDNRVEFDNNKIRSRRRQSEPGTEKRRRTDDDEDQDADVEDPGVSILEAFEPSTDEESDSEDNDDEAFVVRGKDHAFEE